MFFCMKCGTQLAEGANFCHFCGADVNAQRSSEVEVENDEKNTTAVEKTEFIPDMQSCPEPPANASTYVISAPVERTASTEEDRQKLLDTVRKKLIGEKRIWRAVAIVCIVAYVLCVFTAVVSFVSLMMLPGETYYEEDYYYGVDVEYTTDDEEEYEWTQSDTYSIIFALSWMGCIYGVYTVIPAAVFGFIMSSKANKVLKTLYIDCTYAYRRCKSPTIIIFAAVFNPLALIFTIPLFRLARNNGELFEETANIQHNYFA